MFHVGYTWVAGICIVWYPFNDKVQRSSININWIFGIYFHLWTLIRIQNQWHWKFELYYTPLDILSSSVYNVFTLIHSGYVSKTTQFTTYVPDATLFLWIWNLFPNTYPISWQSFCLRSSLGCTSVVCYLSWP